MDSLCAKNVKTLHKLLNTASPVPVADLTPAEHKVAEILATDSRHLLTPWSADEDFLKFLDRRNETTREMKSMLVGTTDKSRLDSILAGANKLLLHDGAKLIQTDKGLILGKRYPKGECYFMQTVIAGHFTKCSTDALKIPDVYNHPVEVSLSIQM
jgi:hypothetical protein